MTNRLQLSVRTTVLGLVTNGCLAFIKLAAGVWGHSYALVADAVESFADIASSIIVWRGVVVAHRPPDADHPYGHGKAETLAAAAVAVLLFMAAVGIFVQSLREIAVPHHVPARFTLAVLAGVVLIKEGLFRKVSRVGTTIDSAAVKTDAWHHRSDAITSAAAAVGISIALVGGPGFEIADDWAAIFAALIIAANGIRLLKPSVHELMDAKPEGDIVEQVRTVALEVAGVKGVEKCFARKMGYTFLLDMHVEVDGTLSVFAAHDLAHQVKDAIRARLPRVSDVTIHIEPFQPAPHGGRDRSS